MGTQAQLESREGRWTEVNSGRWRRPCRSNQIPGIVKVIWSWGSPKHIGARAAPAVTLGLDLRFTVQRLFSLLIPVCGARILHNHWHTVVRLHKHNLCQKALYTELPVLLMLLIWDKAEKEKCTVDVSNVNTRSRYRSHTQNRPKKI